MSQPAKRSAARKTPNLSRWFWGTIIVLAAISVGLTFLAIMQRQEQTPIPLEKLSSTDIDTILSKANRMALEKVTAEIGPLLDKVYDPVNKAVPKYADFHYSVLGQYIELVGPNFELMERKIQEILYSGLEDRLGDVSRSLDSEFEKEFKKILSDEFNLPGWEDADLREQAMIAVDGAMARIQVTAPVATGVAVGTGAVLKGSAKTLAKAVTGKLATKAAIKSGGRLAAMLSGAGGGAVVCSWLGPGAGVCAVGGGIVAWVLTDYAIIKLEELWKRDEFEADLRGLIDDVKANNRIALENALRKRVLAIEKDVGGISCDIMISLKEIYKNDTDDPKISDRSLIEKYEYLRVNSRNIRLAELEDFQEFLDQSQDDPSLCKLVREIKQNLEKAQKLSIKSVRISGNFPEKFRVNRYVSAYILLEGKKWAFVRSEATKADGFDFKSETGADLSLDKPIEFYIALRQHRRVYRDRYFGGAIKVNLLKDIDDSPGLSRTVSLSFPIGEDNGARSLSEVRARPTSGDPIKIEMQLGGSPLAPLKNFPDTTK